LTREVTIHRIATAWILISKLSYDIKQNVTTNKRIAAKDFITEEDFPKSSSETKQNNNL